MRSWGLAVLVVLGCHSPQPAGSTDAPPEPPTPDAAVDADVSAPTDTPYVACASSTDAVYAAVPAPGAALGAILACAPDAQLDATTASSQAGVAATGAVKIYRIAYQTRDGNGGPAVSTARVYLPSTPRARPVPLAVTGHGSVGLADSCAPSHDTENDLPLPYAARGFAAIAPDLAGLGNAGTQDYLDNRAQGWQMLDGARALRRLLAPGVTAPEMILSGYSQGGGAALSARALLPTDGPDAGRLLATAVYAPEWPIRLDSFRYVELLRDPNQLTISLGLSFSSVAVLRQYAYFENHVGAGTGPQAMPASARSSIAGAIDGQCLVGLGAWIQLTMLHTGDLIDDTLRTGLLSCIDGSTCTGVAASYYQALLDDQLAIDPAGGPVLLAQGLLDQIMPPATEAACVRDKLAAASVEVAPCVFSSADHTNIMSHHGSGVAWVESVVDGGARAACGDNVPLPSCGL
jgi:cephalosporin-C deacetylase-like acetyl esterase